VDRYDVVATALRDAAGAFQYPPTPNLSAAVVERIAGLPARRRRVDFWPSRSRIAYATVLVVALVTAALFVPAVRDTVAKWVHVRGLVIDRVPVGSLPTSSPKASAGTGDLRDELERAFQLGGRTTLALARSRAGFPVLAPATLGEPDRTYLEPTALGLQATLLYYPRSALPPSRDARVGLLLSETRAGVNREFIQKYVEGDTTVEPVPVRGVDGFWISGHPHEVVLRGRDGTLSPAELRLAGNTLVWEQGNLTYRLESGLDRAAAVRLAETLR
jgi:hypothetical protein